MEKGRCNAEAVLQREGRSVRRTRRAIGFSSESEHESDDDPPFSQQPPRLKEDELDVATSDEESLVDSQLALQEHHVFREGNGVNDLQCAMKDVESDIFFDPMSCQGENGGAEERFNNDGSLEDGSSDSLQQGGNMVKQPVLSSDINQAQQMRQDTTTRRGSHVGGLPNWEYMSPFTELQVAVDDVNCELET
ncbi:unnamed protein product [Agarophyton chilense]